MCHCPHAVQRSMSTERNSIPTFCHQHYAIAYLRIISGVLMVVGVATSLAIRVQFVLFTLAFVVSGQEYFVNHYYLVMYVDALLKHDATTCVGI
jgi:hypothetical protein